MPTPGSSTRDFPAPVRLINPLKALRERRQLAAFIAHNQARVGTGAQAVAFAIDHVEDHFDRLQFLKDWQAGDLAEWPEYRPEPPKPPALTAHGYLLRSSAALAAFFAGLMLLADLIDFATHGPGDPLRILLTCSWGAAVLICAGAAWRAALQRGEG